MAHLVPAPFALFYHLLSVYSPVFLFRLRSNRSVAPRGLVRCFESVIAKQARNELY